MKIEQKHLKRVGVTTALSALAICVFAIPAFAKSSTTKTVSNELPMEFNVAQKIDIEDTVVISWNSELNTSLRTYDVTEGESQAISYYVSPGEENDDDIIVDVFLKVPVEVAEAIESVKIDDNVIDSLYTEDDFAYYMVKEDLEFKVDDEDNHFFKDEFDITFKKTTSTTPFTASLVAMQEVIEEPEPIKTATPQEGIFYSSTFPVGSTGEVIYMFNAPLGIVNGTAVINLGGGITGFDLANSAYYDVNGIHEDLTEYYNAANKTLTLPISGGEIVELYLNNATFASVAGGYIATLAIDQDGEGSAYSLSDAAGTVYMLEWYD